MQDQIFLIGNLVIMAAYLAIMVAIVVPLVRAGQLISNKLATATALIFFSCAVGHGLHAAITWAYLAAGAHAGHTAHNGAPFWGWASAVWDAVTAGVGVYYWTLRRGYGILLGPGAMYLDPFGKNRLDEADARERAARDIAEAHRATLAAVVEHSVDAIIGLAPDGIITAWNGGAERLFGYPAGAVLGKHAVMLADEDGADHQEDVLTRIRNGERGVAYETRRLRSDGTPVDVSVSVSPILDHRDRVIGISAVARDVTAAKEAAERQRAIQERTQQAQRMESLGKLAGGVAHDFNNILAIIANYTEFAIEETAGTPGVQSDLTQVRTAVERATNLTRQLLTFTRGDAIQPRDVDLNAAIAEVRAMLERTIGAHIDLITAPATTPLAVHADPGQLNQVLLNLAINARDAMADGGTLVLEANTVTLDGEEVQMQPPLPAGTYARLLVSDTGEGMPAEVIAHIFEPFYTTKPVGRGTGLGLATVYGIVTEAGGSINVYSEPGVGTTFRIYLPLAEAGTSAMVPERQAAPPGGGRTVLVVEDEVALARIVTRILTGNGYHVLTAVSGAQALELFGAHEVDVLLTDVIMPEMSGRRLAELLTERRPGLPVLYMSGYSNGLLGTTHVLDGDITFIEKPFTAADLLHKLAAATRHSYSF
ncbi:PAS domain S-box protein [Actinoplanes sp. NPDC051851]|uniref:hybrid sensor histidine kinase/response regulator n=1 Tax=Actinoplanes sp. NPDC051851 TaxID=3154753 RepID=UPI00343F1F1F